MKDTYIRIRIPSALKETLRYMASKQNMSMSELILYLVRREAEKESQ